MARSSSSSARASARIDATLRYRGATEGVLCVARCRELSVTGLTATIDRPVFPGELVRFDLERAAGGTSVVGLARVSWVGSDPEAPSGASTSIMRLRFLSLSDTSHRLINTWLDEVSAVAQRPQPGDDSAVRALGRAIADSLVPPPPQMPGAPPKRGPSIPTPPGYPSPLLSGLPRARTTTPSGLMVGPLNPEALAGDVGSSSGVTTLGTGSPAEARSRQLRKRSKRPTMRGGLTASLAPPAPAPAAPLTSPADLAPPLPLGALLHAPPAQTRRSSPPPPEPLGATSAPPPPDSSAALAEALPPPPPVPSFDEPKAFDEPKGFDEPKAFDEPPAAPRVSSSAPPRMGSSDRASDRASLPLGGPSLPPDEAPWVPREPAKKRWDARFATKRARGWLVLCLASVLGGAGLAYLGYLNDVMPSGLQVPRSERRLPAAQAPVVAPAPPASPPVVEAAAPEEPVSNEDDKLAAQMALPSEAQLAVIAPQPAAAPAPAPVAVEKKKVAPKLVARTAPTAAVAPPAPPTPAAVQPAPAPAPAPAAAAPLPPVVAITPSAPAPAAAPAAPTPGGSRLARARRCLAQGNTGCVIALLEGNASTEAELELWIETLRAEGRGGESRKHMQRYVVQYPEGRRAGAYRRILSHAE